MCQIPYERPPQNNTTHNYEPDLIMLSIAPSSAPFAHHSVAVAVVGADDVRGVRGAIVAHERLQVHHLAVHHQALRDQVRRQKPFRRGQHDIEVQVGRTK